MIDMMTINAAVQSGNVLWKIITASKQLIENNELVAAVSQVNADLIAAQSTTIASQKNELTLTETVRELKEKIVALENWEREKERYALTEIASGVVARRLKPGMEQGEEPHDLCATCFEDRKKSPIQSGPRNNMIPTLRCPRCSATFFPKGPKRPRLPDPQEPPHDPNDPRTPY